MEFGKAMFGDRKTVTLEFTEDLLGPVPKNKEIYAKYIQSKAPVVESGEPPEDEVETVEDAEHGGWTGFHSDKTGLFIYNYWLKGFFKTSVEALVEADVFDKVPAYKKWIDRMVFIHPRRLYFVHNVKEAEGVLERPLRGMTRKGERIALTRSDLVKAGAKLKFTVELLPNKKNLDWDCLGTALDYGRYVGMGAWRGSGGYGQFNVKGFKDEDHGEKKWVRSKRKQDALAAKKEAKEAKVLAKAG